MSHAPEHFPAVYGELRRLAAAKLAAERPGHTLDATALVHEAYLRLGQSAAFGTKSEFFRAAAEAMRRILVESARHKQSIKAGGDRCREKMPDIEAPGTEPEIDLLALNEALIKFETQDKRRAELVKLRFFAGFTIEQAAQALGVSTSTADNDWAYARSWLRVEMQERAGGQA